MNRYMKTLVLAFCSVAAVRAMEQEALLKGWMQARQQHTQQQADQQELVDVREKEFTFDADISVLPGIDEKEVIAFKKLLQSEDKQRGTYQKAALAGVLITGFALWCYWSSRSNAKELATAQKLQSNLIELELSNRKEKEKKAEELKKLQEEARAKGEPEPKELPKKPATPPVVDPAQGDDGWISWACGAAKNYAQGVAKSGWSWAIVVPGLLVKSRIAHEMGNYLFGFFPYPGRVANFVFYPWSLNWCLNERTQFYKATVGLKSLTAQMLVPGEKPHPSLKRKLWYSSHLFVSEMEKVLGYMHFIVASLRPGEDKMARGMGRNAIENLRDDLNEYAQKMTMYLQLPEPTVQHMRAIARISEDMLWTVICQIESFEYIANVAGQEDADRRDRFAYWKSFIKPDQLPDSPKIQEDKARAEEDAEFKAMFDLAVKINDAL